MPLLLHEELGDVDGVEELRERQVDGDDHLPDGGRRLVGDGVVAVVDAADGAALEDHVVLRQGARLITEYVLDLKIWTFFVDPRALLTNPYLRQDNSFRWPSAAMYARTQAPKDSVKLRRMDACIHHIMCTFYVNGM